MKIENEKLTSLYVLLFPDRSMLKVGKANNVATRGKLLSNAWGGIDYGESYELVAPTSVVFKLEKSLHYLLLGHKVDISKADGYTEMFDIKSIDAVMMHIELFVSSLKFNISLKKGIQTLVPVIAAKRIRYNQNPFLNGVSSTFNNDKISMCMRPGIVKLESLTEYPECNPGEVVKLIDESVSTFAHIYSLELATFWDLSGSARGVVEYLVHVHQEEPNRHLVVLHRAFAQQAGFEIPESTWFTGIRELIEKDFLAASKVPNSYYLNPAIFFNGDRTRFITEIRKQREKSIGR